jgi:hypothetical protein
LRHARPDRVRARHAPRGFACASRRWAWRGRRRSPWPSPPRSPPAGPPESSPSPHRTSCAGPSRSSRRSNFRTMPAKTPDAALTPSPTRTSRRAKRSARPPCRNRAGSPPGLSGRRPRSTSVRPTSKPRPTPSLRPRRPTRRAGPVPTRRRAPHLHQGRSPPPRIPRCPTATIPQVGHRHMPGPPASPRRDHRATTSRRAVRRPALQSPVAHNSASRRPSMKARDHRQVRPRAMAVRDLTAHR